ncbi:hypothetical protein Mapa_012114 [Marchantia paleacea]|nr:hypothetical protein Mapa_012114 [Marchantia paleacea]
MDMGSFEQFSWVQQIVVEKWRMILGTTLVLYIVYEQLSHLWKAKHLPGPKFVVPILGNAYGMVTDPVKFWEDQAKTAMKTGLSWNVLLGKFIVFVRDTELSRKIFMNVSPDGFRMIIHPFGKDLFGADNNFIFMLGEEHRDLRKRLGPIFTYKALALYVSIQDSLIRKHITQWIKLFEIRKEPLRMRFLLRDMNLETSQTSFVGTYLSEEERIQFNKNYEIFNKGTMTLPFNIPGTTYYKAKNAAPFLIDALAKCAGLSRDRMSKGEEPACVIDFILVETSRVIDEAKAAGKPAPSYTSDDDIGAQVFDFLFAAQDASTSSLAWSIVFLDSHPEILAKVREEQNRVRPDLLAPITPEQLLSMEYTTMYVKEVLRYRPPATLVPHLALTDDFMLTDTYKIPKGALVFPSLLESSFQGFVDPYKFDPDRFSPARQEDVVYKRNWLLFGAGPHQCVGQRYALNQLTLFTALWSTLVDMDRARTPDCDEMIYTPTISPKDDVFGRVTRRFPVA